MVISGRLIVHAPVHEQAGVAAAREQGGTMAAVEANRRRRVCTAQLQPRTTTTTTTDATQQETMEAAEATKTAAVVGRPSPHSAISVKVKSAQVHDRNRSALDVGFGDFGVIQGALAPAHLLRRPQLGGYAAFLDAQQVSFFKPCMTEIYLHIIARMAD